MDIPQAKRYSTDFGGKELILETGKYAKLVSSAVMVRYGGTVLMVTAHMSDHASSMDFLPLTVEYEERHYAVGKIPGSFNRREGRPGEQATLNARIVDRQIRPLFPKGLRHEVQVIVTVLSADQEHDPAPLAAIGASAALSLSNIPWQGPTACVRVGRIEDAFVINPSYQELKDSEVELVLAGSQDAVLMVEAGASELSEDIMIDAIERGQDAMQPVIALIAQMQQEIGKEKEVIEPALAVSEQDMNLVEEQARAAGLREVLTTEGKKARRQAIRELRDSIVEPQMEGLEPDEEAERRTLLNTAFEKAMQREVRRMVLHEGMRSDGRGTSDIRPIWIEASVLPQTHGSAVFTRGETQVLAVATLGTGRDNRLVDDLSNESSEEFMLHYNFPPFSTGEVRRMRGTSRRELGHGNLARRALERMMPTQEDFPYVIRVVAETLESNGSSSMATVCASSLALMDAGVPLAKPVAGIAMGLVKEGDSYQVLSDILGSEDALGDMDFKVTGTNEGITALQMDIKITGITPTIMRQALAQAREGRLHILGLMREVLDAPRDQLSEHAPQIVTIQIPTDKIGAVIGPGGKNIRELESVGGGVSIEIAEDGNVKIFSEDGAAAQEVRERIKMMTATAEVGVIYEGTVAKVVDFGAFVTLFPGTDGLLHISQLAPGRVERVEDYLKEGDTIRVKVNTIDARSGKIDLVRPELEGIVAPRQPRESRGGSGGGRGGRGGGGGRR